MHNSKTLSTKKESIINAVLEVLVDIEEAHLETFGTGLKFMVDSNPAELPAFMTFIVSRIFLVSRMFNFI